jgi:hypothetical protein
MDRVKGADMIVFVNDYGEIHDVNTTTDPKLTPIEVTDGSLDDMSEALICCYKVKVVDGVVTMRTPYVPSTVLESIDRLGKQTEAITPKQFTKTAYIEDTEVVFSGVPTGNMTVYCSVPHTVERDGDRVTVRFEPLEEVTEVTISIL